MNEQSKYETIKKLVNHNKKRASTSIKLDISIRQINHLIITYRKKIKMALYMIIDYINLSMLLIAQLPKRLYYYIINIKTSILDVLTSV